MICILLEKNFEFIEVIVYNVSVTSKKSKCQALKENEMKSLTRREEQVLLAIFHLKDEAYLITIREMIKKYTGKYYSVGTIYAPLNKLHIDGYLDAFLKKPSLPERGKPIKYYSLTKKGFKALEQLKKLHSQMWEGFKSPILEKKV